MCVCECVHVHVCVHACVSEMTLMWTCRRVVEQHTINGYELHYMYTQC